MDIETICVRLRSSEWSASQARFEAVEALASLLKDREVYRQNMRETYEAMVAMRNSINEFIPMPSLESDLLQGPDNSVFCAAVAEAVVAEIRKLRAELANGSFYQESDIDRPMNERDTARAKVERLRGALEQIVRELVDAETTLAAAGADPVSADKFMVNIRDGRIVGTDNPEVPDGTYVWADDLPSKGGTLFRSKENTNAG